MEDVRVIDKSDSQVVPIIFRNILRMEEVSNLRSSASISHILSKLKIIVKHNLFKYEEQQRQVNTTEQENRPCWGSLVLILIVCIIEDANQLHSFHIMKHMGFVKMKENILSYMIIPSRVINCS